MKTALAFLASFALGLLLASAPAQARPPAPLPLALTLNGEAVRPLQADGGGLMLYSTTTAVASATVACGGVYKVTVPGSAIGLCTSPTDGGCSATQSDPNYGDVVAGAGFVYIVVDDCTAGTKTITAVSSSGAGVSAPIFKMR